MDRSVAYVRLGEEEQRWIAEREARGLEHDAVGVESAVGSTVQAGDRSDVSMAARVRDEDAEFVRAAQHALAAIDAARDRLENGTYGICESCHQPIAEERLLALPSTRFCIRHA